jgi:hypothetical protein
MALEMTVRAIDSCIYHIVNVGWVTRPVSTMRTGHDVKWSSLAHGPLLMHHMLLSYEMSRALENTVRAIDSCIYHMAPISPLTKAVWATKVFMWAARLGEIFLSPDETMFKVDEKF